MIHELFVGLALITGIVFLARRARQPLVPESHYVVRVTEREVTCTDPDGVTKWIACSDVSSIRIRTFDTGPFDMDVIWGFHGPSGEPVVLVPNGATGEREMLAALSKWPGWDDSVVIDAMGCTSNRVFVVWERDQPEPE